MNVFVQVFLGTYISFSFFLSNYLGVEFPGNRVGVYLALLKTCLDHFVFPLTRYENSVGFHFQRGGVYILRCCQSHSESNNICPQGK